MKTISQYLDDAKEISGSDYMTAKYLGVSRGAVSKWRKSGTIKTENAAKLGSMIDVDPGQIVAASDVTLHPENKKYWAKWAAAVVAIVAVTGFSFETAIPAYYESAGVERVMYYA